MITKHPKIFMNIVIFRERKREERERERIVGSLAQTQLIAHRPHLSTTRPEISFLGPSDHDYQGISLFSLPNLAPPLFFPLITPIPTSLLHYQLLRERESNRIISCYGLIERCLPRLGSMSQTQTHVSSSYPHLIYIFLRCVCGFVYHLWIVELFF